MHVAMVYCSRLQLAAPIGRSLFASLGPFPSIGGGAHRPLTTLCPSSPSLAYLGPRGGGGGGGRVNIRRESIIVAGTLPSRGTDIISASVSAPRDASLEPLGSRPVGAEGGSQDYRTFCTHVQQAFHYKLCKEEGGGGGRAGGHPMRMTWKVSSRLLLCPGKWG